MHLKGMGVPPDNKISLMWLIISAANGFKDTEDNISYVKKRMTKLEIYQAQKLSVEWMVEHLK